MKPVIASLAVVLAVSCGSPPCSTSTPVCAPGGAGSIQLTVSGLPAGVSGRVTLSGPGTLSAGATRTFDGAASGAWGVTAEKATDHDPRVRHAWQATPSPASFCLPDGGSEPVAVPYALIPSSNTLWATTSNSTSGQVMGFAAASLRTTGTHAADVAVKGPGGGDLAFDLDGNLWTLGPTTADATLNRFPAATLGSSGQKTPDRALTLSGPGCTPLAAGLAFDPQGNLWLSSPCRHHVLELDAAALAASGEVTPSVTLAVADPLGLAFDAAGNLWAADQSTQRVLRFDAASLSSASPTATLTLGALATDTAGDPSVLTPTWLAFDSGGNLWSNDFGGNIFFRLSASDLGRTGDQKVTPRVRVTSGVTAVLEGFAFDEEGGLWSAGTQGTLVRFAAEQLLVSSTAGSPTQPSVVLTSTDLGSAANVALYPAPASSPLFAHLR